MRIIIPLRTYVLKVFVLLILAATSITQAQSQDSEVVRQYYDRIYGVDQRLVSGDYNYGPTRGSIAGHPYWVDETWKKGEVLLDSTMYANLLLRYDIYENQIVMRFISREQSPLNLSLNKSKIDRFRIEDLQFIPFPASNDSLNRRFCQLVVEGTVDYLVLKSKELVPNNGNGMTDYEYKELTKQYLVVDDRLVLFGSRRAIFRLDPARKKQVKAYIRKSHMSLRKTDLSNRAMLISYYNELINGSE